MREEGKESASRSKLRSQYGFSQDPKSQRPDVSRKTARESQLTLGTFLERHRDSSDDDDDMYSTVRALEAIAQPEGTPSEGMKTVGKGKTGFDYRVSHPT